MHALALQRTAIFLVGFTLLLAAPGCIRYWEDVNKLEQQRFELEDQLKWQAREEEMKSKEAAATPPAEAPVKASDY